MAEVEDQMISFEFLAVHNHVIRFAFELRMKLTRILNSCHCEYGLRATHCGGGPYVMTGQNLVFSAALLTKPLMLSYCWHALRGL